MPAGRGRSPREDGFTLIELMIVIAIIALLGAMVVPAAESITGANARKAAGELSAAMRALFDTAALRHATCRLVLDLDARTWSAECAPGAVGAPPVDDDEKTLAERFPGEADPEIKRLLAASQFGALSDRLVAKRELPGKVGFGPVHVGGRRDALESGTVFVYFFPGGRAQRAWVPVVDGSNLYTVVGEPFTGRARVVPGKVEAKE
jgi:general secretion pathway protein H